MGNMSKQKGKQGEKEVVMLLQQVIDELYLPINCRPILRQTEKSSGFDLTGVHGLAFEVKRRETLQLNQWWLQAKAQALTATQQDTRGAKWRPVLIYRQNRQPWRVRTYAMLDLPLVSPCQQVEVVSDMDFDQFLVWFKLYIQQVYGYDV